MSINTSVCGVHVLLKLCSDVCNDNFFDCKRLSFLTNFGYVGVDGYIRCIGDYVWDTFDDYVKLIGGVEGEKGDIVILILIVFSNNYFNIRPIIIY